MKRTSLLLTFLFFLCGLVWNAAAAPTIVSARRTYVDHTQITVVFSEALSGTTATNVSNYAINNGISVGAAGVGGDPSIVVLTASPISDGSIDTLTVNGVQDTNGVTIAANSQIQIATAPLLPAEFGTSINGFQDDFDAANMDTNWAFANAQPNTFSQANGLMKATTGGYESPHLLYEPSAYSYDAANQTILARVRVETSSVGYAFNYGVGVGEDASISEGLDLIFADIAANVPPNFPLQHSMMVQFGIGWGPGLYVPDNVTPIGWQPYTWYWMRLKQGFELDGTNSGFAKVWLADGDTPEPTNWSQVWAYTQFSDQLHTGFAGLLAGDNAAPGQSSFDYVLIEAAGFPSITPKADFLSAPVATPTLTFSQGPQNATNYQGLSATLSVSVSSSYPVVFYRWEKHVGSLWAEVGGDNSSYTTPSLSSTNSGDTYRVSVSIPGTNIVSAAATVTVIPFQQGFTQQPTNITVTEGSMAKFTVAETNSLNAIPTYQWQRQDPGGLSWNNIALATQSSYTTLPTTVAADNGAQYQVVVATPASVVTSTPPAILTVVPAAPNIVLARRLISNNSQVAVVFSAPVTNALQSSSYTIDGGIVVNAAVMGNNPNTVLLTTSPAIQNGSSHTLTVNNVKDLYGLTIAANSQAPISLSALLPNDAGSLVSGYQDKFDAGTLNTNWVGTPHSFPESGQAFTLASGYLQVGKANRETPSLQWVPPTPYDSVNQEVLARVFLTGVTSTNSGDAFSAGVGIGINGITSDQGVDFVFRNTPFQAPGGFPVPHARSFSPGIAWGPGVYTDGTSTTPLTWTNGAWYWMRLRQQFNPTGPDAVGKIWLADGDTPEPATWGGQWDYASTASQMRSGYAGILAGDAEGGGDGLPALPNEYMDVDYVLIKAAGLPPIVAWPEVLGGLKLFIFKSNGGGETLSWGDTTSTLQSANAVTGSWTDVIGATSPYTVTNSGSQFFRLRQ